MPPMRRSSFCVRKHARGAGAESGRMDPAEKSRHQSNFRDDPGSRDTHDTIATSNGNVRNGAEKFRTFRSRAHHEIRDFKRCLVIGY
jgi:hypothetical protein